MLLLPEQAAGLFAVWLWTLSSPIVFVTLVLSSCCCRCFYSASVFPVCSQGRPKSKYSLLGVTLFTPPKPYVAESHILALNINAHSNAQATSMLTFATNCRFYKY